MVQNTKALLYRPFVLPLHFLISFTLHNISNQLIMKLHYHLFVYKQKSAALEENM